MMLGLYCSSIFILKVEIYHEKDNIYGRRERNNHSL